MKPFMITRRSVILASLSVAARAYPAVHAQSRAFEGGRAGEQRDIDGVVLGWCPAGRFVMGSPPGELERRLGADQVSVTRTRGFWRARYATAQAQWRRTVGELPGPLTAELTAGDDSPVGNVNFAEAAAFCR